MRTIRVTGKGSISVRPDTTRITITLSEKLPEYSDAVSRSADDTEKLGAVLAPFGFDRSDLKTLSFDINAEYENYLENDVYKQKFTGYRYTHQMKVEFISDNDRLGKVLYAIANSDLHPEFVLSYTVSDTEAVKNELLGKAVSDSAVKASALAKAAGVTLGDVQTIDYSWGRTEFEVRPTNRVMSGGIRSAKAVSFDMNIEPDSITVEDTVTIVWEIKNSNTLPPGYSCDIF